jgi:tetratricopeptide (TPR) repeat protein
MLYKHLLEKYIKCCQLVTTQRLQESFVVLEELVGECHNEDFSVQLSNYRETYSNILKYSFGEVEDPEKKMIYFRLLRSLVELADEVKESIIYSQNLLSRVSIKKEENGKNIYSKKTLEKFLRSFGSEIIYNNPKTITNDETDTDLLYQEQHKKITYLFNHFWLTNKYQDTEKDLISIFAQSETIPWWVESLIISAITLSLQRYFDETKLIFLLEAYKRFKHQVWQRALSGIIISLYQYNQRLYLYPGIMELLDSLHATSDIDKQLESAIIQFIKSRDTEKIAKKFQDEILPEMTRIQSRIHDKLDIMNIVQDPFSEDKNPDWEHVFQDSPGLLNKLEEFSRLQVEGSDVFMNTFSLLKHFDFFSQISNWFLPFYKENPEISQVLKGENSSFDANGFIESMEKSSILCNSDKYSFCLNLKLVPVDNRTAMMELFNAEIKAVAEITDEDKLLHKPEYERVVFTQYVQDLYRFNKLYSNKQEFYDIFSTKADFHNTVIFDRLIKNESVIRNIGEFLFEKNYFQDAIEIFTKIDTKEGDFEIWQKTGYCYQQLGNYQKALEYYLRADLADTRKPWNVKKIGLCYRRLGNYPKALEYYLEAEKLEPENLNIQANIAHTYLDMKDYENALKFYFKVEFLAPDNIKIQRPIAWCSFMLAKLDTAKKYFEKIPDKEGNQHDFLNLGHIEWCLGNKKKAIERYRQSILKAGSDFYWFVDEFMADSEVLIRYGIDPVNIPLMRDYLKILLQ